MTKFFHRKTLCLVALLVTAFTVFTTSAAPRYSASTLNAETHLAKRVDCQLPEGQSANGTRVPIDCGTNPKGCMDPHTATGSHQNQQHHNIFPISAAQCLSLNGLILQ